VTSALALHEALFHPDATVLLLSPGQPQSGELFRKVLSRYNTIGRSVKANYEAQLKIELENKSRIIYLPGKEETVRCSSPTLLVIDEASRVPDDVYRSVRPVLAVTQGLLLLSTRPVEDLKANGKRQCRRVARREGGAPKPHHPL